MARTTSGLTDMQTLHLFHRLLRLSEQYSDSSFPPTAAQFANWQNETRRQIEANTQVSESQRGRWLTQLQRAETEETLPSASMFYARRYLLPQVGESRIALERTYNRLGAALGLSEEQTRERVRQLEQEFAAQLAATGSGRQRSQIAGPEVISNLEQQLAALPPAAQNDLNAPINLTALPQDKATLYVLSQLWGQVAQRTSEVGTSALPQAQAPAQTGTESEGRNSNWQDWRTTTRLTQRGADRLAQAGLSDEQIGELLTSVEVEMRQRWGENLENVQLYPLPDNYVAEALHRTQSASPTTVPARRRSRPSRVNSSTTAVVPPPPQASTPASARAPKLSGQEGEAVYQQWVQELTASRAAGSKPPYETENVLGEAAANFGVELEFRGADADKVARRLYEMGLAAHSEMVEYHHPRNPPCRVCEAAGQDKWKVERDGSVTDNSSGRNLGGEVVAPILSDTPQHWEQLQSVTEVLQQEGAYVDHNTGQHIHVSTAAYSGNDQEQARAYRDLVGLVGGNEDLLFRMAAPQVGLHRGLVRTDHEAYHYTQPIAPRVERLISQNPNPSLTEVLGSLGYYERSAHSRNVPQAHYLSLNVQHVNPQDSTSSRVEFRMFNGTIDPVQIQTNVRLAAGLVHAAKSSAASQAQTQGQPGLASTGTTSQGSGPTTSAVSSGQERRGLGWHKQHRKANEDSVHIRQLVDRLNLSENGAKALLDTFVRSSWQRTTRPSNRAEIEREVAAYSGVR